MADGRRATRVAADAGAAVTVAGVTIQVAIGNGAYALALRESLVRNGVREVVCVNTPDLERGGVLVLDREQLERLAVPLTCPERVVLIAGNDAGSLARAWDIGLSSVVSEKDPLNTAVLAVMSAALRAGKGAVPGPACDTQSPPECARRRCSYSEHRARHRR